MVAAALEKREGIQATIVEQVALSVPDNNGRFLLQTRPWSASRSVDTGAKRDLLVIPGANWKDFDKKANLYLEGLGLNRVEPSFATVGIVRTLDRSPGGVWIDRRRLVIAADPVPPKVLRQVERANGRSALLSWIDGQAIASRSNDLSRGVADMISIHHHQLDPEVIVFAPPVDQASQYLAENPI